MKLEINLSISDNLFCFFKKSKGLNSPPIKQISPSEFFLISSNVMPIAFALFV